MSYVIDPIAFSIGPLDVNWYGMILGSAAIAGLLLAILEGKRFNLSSDFFLDLLLIGVPSAIIGARLYYVLFKWDSYKDNLLEIIMIQNGGLAIHGALIGAVIGAAVYFRVKRVSFWRIADICAPSLILGQMIGRWGNFMNQEAHGGPVEEAFLRETLNLPNFIVNQMNINGVFYHPTFLYESIWNLAGLLLLFVLRRRTFVKSGEVFFTYIMWYSLGRFFIEGLRTDSLAFTGPQFLADFMEILWAPMLLVFGDAGNMAYGNIRIAQFISLLLIVFAIIMIFIRRIKNPDLPKYSDPIERY
ncbi:prolipoprotein diacylglyceryl transferase [Chengkuizengella axinellae]|uniref:Phosphatidylglycerol--prolipoprotein diacylglyceryl transferase n=1 Tax=Chengkuizengella axinellae TaxID=3064388 RepID=A0ABT9J2I1_9BACL|nr:prolipoprotein diacylglyceryl transferase [Chengkuizengella sp. 2205SS18-9]MDP5275812.1 prolipoprotein diacylglyceryl transferase [Chengkuizengella sp. 2205SS18-9]